MSVIIMYEFYFNNTKSPNTKQIRKCYEIKRPVCISTLHTIFEAHYDSKYSFVGESHNFWECVYVIRGNVSVTSNDKIYNLSDNEMIFHKPFEFHNLNFDSSAGADIFIFSFTDTGEFIQYFKNKVFKLSDEQKNTVNSLLLFMNKKYSEKCKKDVPVLKNFAECFNDSSTFQGIVISYIELLFMQLYDDANLLVLSNSTDPKAEIFKTAVNFMKTNIGSNLSVTDIARECHTSTTGLKQIFMNFAKLGVHKYFLHLKITAATKLLESGESVNKVSESLGFSSPGYFSSVYKRETGFSPSDIKK